MVSKSCNECIHFQVCCIEKDFAKLKATINDLGKLLENKEFNITAACKHHQPKGLTLELPDIPKDMLEKLQVPTGSVCTVDDIKQVLDKLERNDNYETTD